MRMDVIVKCRCDVSADSLLFLRPHLFQQVPYTFYVKDTEVMESLEQTVSELGERSTQPFAWNVVHKALRLDTRL